MSVDDALLTQPTYEVLKRVPSDWMDEATVKYEISRATATTTTNVAQRLAHLREMNLVERRVAPTRPGFELRKIGKTE